VVRHANSKPFSPALAAPGGTFRTPQYSPIFREPERLPGTTIARRETSQNFRATPLARSGVPFLLFFLLASCGGPSFLVPLHGDPKEAQELLEEDGKVRDDRPASVRITERFFKALGEDEPELCWYLLDLRAAAAWQAAMTPPGSPGPTPEEVVDRIRAAWPTALPGEVKRLAYDREAGTAKVRATWARARRTAEIDLFLSTVGWRLIILPPGARLAAVDRDPRPTDVAAPIERNVEEEPVAPQPRHQRQPFGGGGVGY
jgi:hypothetical protein